jgi:hypothetical protein
MALLGGFGILLVGERAGHAVALATAGDRVFRIEADEVTRLAVGSGALLNRQWCSLVNGPIVVRGGP